MIGVVFLAYDGFLMLFVGWDVRAGSHFFVTWEIIQTLVAVVLIAIGSAKKFKAHVKDNA